MRKRLWARSLPLVSFATLASAFCGVTAGHAQKPYDSALVTLVENKVSIGEEKKGRTVEKKASISDVVTAKQFVLTSAQSRAELEFKDHSIVRVGQNSIFSFDAGTRTLSLEKGAMLFCVPPGSGGGQIKTPSLTAAITGTIGKVSANLIAVIKGSLDTQWGKVPEGYAIESINGSVRIFKFDPCAAREGKLWTFGGPLPEFPNLACTGELTFDSVKQPDSREIDIQQITQVDPFLRPQPESPKMPPMENGDEEFFDGSNLPR
jgi:hypothetical protein